MHPRRRQHPSSRSRSTIGYLTGLAVVLGTTAGPVAAADAPLPDGVQVVWDGAQAHRETTPTRERICINGLWRWQPADSAASVVPEEGWGYFKVPGCWPGITDYMQKDSQTVHAHPRWRDASLRGVTAAWYQREIAVPENWAGRRLALTAEYLNSYAAVYLDGQRAGELRFPAGELDLTDRCRPGGKHLLSLLVVALPLKGVMLSYTDSASAREVKGTVERRGLCGDVFLVSTPVGARITEVTVATSVRNGELAIEVATTGLADGAVCSVAGRIAVAGRERRAFRHGPFRAADREGGRIRVRERWQPEELWDIHTPQNQFELRVSLLDAAGGVLDEYPVVRSGFSEFWIDGRDFYLNGSRLFLSAVPLDNAQIGAAAATYASARESLERLRTLGINFVYTHNYDCTPGAHLSFGEILRAADDVGMLVALTQPHFSHYEWGGADADRTNGYARDAAFYVGVAQNHPSVVMYATSHNATGYNEDMNPDLMDGRFTERDQWSANNARKALRAEAIIRALDPHRPVYHHASGNLGVMHSINFYPNFVPVQELSDWFEPWATTGVKPLFLCEYGAPFTWDWAMYRGWHQGKREFGSAVVPWEFCLAEWNAQFFGDAAFPISEAEKRNLRWEARQFRDGTLWHRWDYPHQLGSTDFPEREPVFARYFADNWRAFRTWGLSANSPWEHHILFTLRPGMNRNQRQPLPVDWANLQRPGYSPDYLGERYERMDLAYERADWVPTAAARALIRNNGPVLGYIAGKPGRFTSQDHLFVPGETVEKQLVVINNARRPVECAGAWSCSLGPSWSGRTNVVLETGQQARVPLRWTVPAGATAGEHRLTAEFRFNTGETQQDEFLIQVLSPPPVPRVTGRLALYDPEGQTAALLERLAIPFQKVAPDARLGADDRLIVGKGALTVRGATPELAALRQGLRVLVFEQTAEALEKRLGFRVAEYGLRQAFARVPNHPVLAGVAASGEAAWQDWRGAATLLPPRLKYELNSKFNGAPSVTWCGLPVTRLWRCGNQGNVASVLIEKPACGDFLPLVDGGFSLQYSPLLEYREGRGLILFCQLDVTGRTEAEPAAEILTTRLIEYLGSWKAAPERPEALYAGEPAGAAHLIAARFPLRAYAGGDLDPATDALILGPGASTATPTARAAIGRFLDAGGPLLAIGQTQADVDALLPVRVSLQPAEYVSTAFAAPPAESWAAGLGPADTHCRDPRVIPLVAGGAQRLGNGVLARATNANLVFCQLAPWQFDYRKNAGLKRTFRRTSFLLARLLGNLGVRGGTPLRERWATPVRDDEPGRWIEGFYLDRPEEWDDPYRFFRW